jgi:ATP-binding cassette subfamily B protein
MSDTPIADQAETDRPLTYLLGQIGRANLPYLFLGVFSGGLAKVLGRLNIFVLGLAFDAVFGERQLLLPLVPDAWIPAGQSDLLVFCAGLLLVIALSDNALGIVCLWGLGIFSQRVMHDIRVDSFDAAQRLEMGFFDSEQTGEVMSVLNNDVNSLESFLDSGMQQTVNTSVLLASTVAFMALLNWQLTLIVLTAAPLVIGANVYFSKVLERLYGRFRSEEGSLNAQIETNLSGVAVIKAFTGEAYESERVRTASASHRDAGWDVRRINARHWPAMNLISGIWLVVAFAAGAYWVLNGPPWVFSVPLTTGALVSFLFYTRALSGPLGMMTRIIAQFSGAKAAAKRIVGLRHSDWRVDDEADADPIQDVRGDVTYDGVSFSYPGTDDRVIDDLSVSVDREQTVGIVGSTGAGKSTLIKLLLRFYRPNEGTIRIDGRDIETVTRRSLRGAIGYVGQDPFLFDGTVRENIAYGVNASGGDAEGPSDDDIVRAAKEAGAHEFIVDLDDGYETQVGERGVKLSGGQRQRIAIARAVVGDPAILIFDEATSHVDNETEVLIQQNLDRLTADRTTFVIAHRLSTVRDADDIIVLDDGQIAERGSHDELLDREGAYAKLWHVQVGELDALPAEFVERVKSDTPPRGLD